MKKNRQKNHSKEITFKSVSLINIDIPANMEELLPELEDGIFHLRQDIAERFGFIPPSITVSLMGNEEHYDIKMEDLSVAGGYINKALIFIWGPEECLYSFKGTKGTEPGGTQGIWIKPSLKDKAVKEGCRIYLPVDIIIDNLRLIAFKYVHRLLGLEQTQFLLDTLRDSHPVLIEQLVPGVFSLRDLSRILKNLLLEKVSLRPLINILETLGDYSHLTKDTDLLTEHVRRSLGSYICKDYKDDRNTITVMTADARMERIFLKGIIRTEQGVTLELDPELRRKLRVSLTENIEKFKELGLKPVLISSPETRLHLKRFTEYSYPDLIVLSIDEIPSHIKTLSYGIVSIEDAEAYIESGDQYYKENKLELAESEYRRAVELDSANARAHYALRLTYRKMGKLDLALQEYRKAIELDPKYEFIDLGFDEKEKKLEDLMEEKLIPVETQDKQEITPEIELIIPQVKKKNSALKIEESIYIDHDRIEKMKGLNPSFATIFNKMGEDYLKVKNYESAKKEFNKAIEIDENYPEPHKNLGIIYFHEQDWFMCRKELEKAIEINPDYLDAYIYLGKLFKMRNMRDKAENAFYRAWDLANKKSDVKAREEIKKELQELKN
ncbi:MAG: FHIPEP family type III secretion protein [Candidatus Eremiobacterota bacterium]